MPTAAGLYYEEHGPTGAPVVLLSSGLGGSAGYWRPNIALLAERYRVIAYDQRGTGRSERVIAGDLTVQRMADDVLALLDALAIERATLVGHALGGLIGLALAIVAPRRLDRLVLVNAWDRLDPHTARCFDTRLALLRDSGPRAYLHAQPLFLYPPQWISDHHEALQAEEEEMLAHFPGPEMMQRRIAAARRFSPGDALAAITVPSLVIASEDDMLVPPSRSARLAEALPRATLARVPAGGHACNVTYPDHFSAALIDWLDRPTGE